MTSVAFQSFVVSFFRVFIRIFLFSDSRGSENLEKLIEIREERKKIPIIFVANHICGMDPLYITGEFPRRIKGTLGPITFPMYHKHMERYRYLEYFLKKLGCVPVGDGKGGGIRPLTRQAKEGETLFLFPEGKRTDDGSMGKDKGLLASIANLTDVIVVPIYIDGIRRIEKDIWNIILRRRVLKVVFGEPEIVEKLCKGDRLCAMSLIRELRAKSIDAKPVYAN